MKRTRLLAILAIAVVAGLMVTGCKGPMDLKPTPMAGVATHSVPYPPEVYTIWAGQNQNAGNVSVWFDATNLYIKYQTTGNWWLEETHAHVALTLDGIPHTKKGSPIPGQFEFKNSFSPRVQTWTYTIPKRDGWVCDAELYIATHCVVAQLVDGKYVNRQTGWSGPNEFPGSNWALYIKYQMRCYKDVDLPADSVWMQVHDVITVEGPTNEVSTFIVTLSGVPGVPGDYAVWNGDWRGWCLELGADILDNHPYRVKLYSNQDPNLPLHLQSDKYDNINYLINHKVPGAKAVEIQKAIWYVMNHNNPYPGSPAAQQMIYEAETYGDGWHPGHGQWVGVLMHGLLNPPAEGDIQLVFIEVDP